VNFGGWLLLEKWMTPTLFAGTNAEDEHSFVQTDGAKEKIEHHRQTFIQEEDFVWLANHGINAIRLPIGYWILEPDGPYVEGISYVDWAFAMADTYNFKILLDLHGVPGSQNGKDHSGQIGRAAWLTDERKQDATLAILERLHERYKLTPKTSHMIEMYVHDGASIISQNTTHEPWRKAIMKNDS
jgi:glucan 1,3-beta-glucosidase